MPSDHEWSATREPEVDDELDKLRTGGGKAIAAKIDQHLDALLDRWAVLDPRTRVQVLTKSTFQLTRFKGEAARREGVLEAHVGESKGRRNDSKSHRLYSISLDKRRELRHLILTQKDGHKRSQSDDGELAAERAAAYCARLARSEPRDGR